MRLYIQPHQALLNFRSVATKIFCNNFPLILSEAPPKRVEGRPPGLKIIIKLSQKIVRPTV